MTKLCAEYGKTVVLTTHQLDMAQELCSRVAIIKDGTLLANRPVKGLLELSAVESYEVRVKGRLDPALELPGHVNISNSGDGDETVITGIGADQEKLHEVLRWVHGLNLPVLSVDRGAPDLEDVYLRLIEEGK